MFNSLPDQLRDAYDSTTRLYRLQGAGELSELLVEAWSLKEGHPARQLGGGRLFALPPAL